MKNIYKIEILNGYMTETKTGYTRPEILKTLLFKNYYDALKAYKAEKAKKAGAVLLYKNDVLKHFKTI